MSKVHRYNHTDLNGTKFAKCKTVLGKHRTTLDWDKVTCKKCLSKREGKLDKPTVSVNPNYMTLGKNDKKKKEELFGKESDFIKEIKEKLFVMSRMVETLKYIEEVLAPGIPDEGVEVILEKVREVLELEEETENWR